MNASISAKIVLNVPKWELKLGKKWYSFVETLILVAAIADPSSSDS